MAQELGPDRRGRLGRLGIGGTPSSTSRLPLVWGDIATLLRVVPRDNNFETYSDLLQAILETMQRINATMQKEHADCLVNMQKRNTDNLEAIQRELGTL